MPRTTVCAVSSGRDQDPAQVRRQGRHRGESLETDSDFAHLWLTRARERPAGIVRCRPSLPSERIAQLTLLFVFFGLKRPDPSAWVSILSTAITLQATNLAAPPQDDRANPLGGQAPRPNRHVDSRGGSKAGRSRHTCQQQQWPCSLWRTYFGERVPQLGRL